MKNFYSLSANLTESNGKGARRRGWRGDVKNMLLHISKIRELGWKPIHNIQHAIKKATQKAITE